MNAKPSPWLIAWDQIDLAWQRMEALLLSMLFAVIVGSALLNFAFALIGRSAPDFSAGLVQAGLLWVAMLAASLSLAELGRRASAPPSGSWQTLRFGLIWLLTGLVSLLLAMASLRFLALDLHLGSAPVLGLSKWALLLPLPLVFVVNAVRSFRHAVRPLAG